MPARSIEVQGHRGAAGLLSENTLPSFESALDIGATSIETDVLLTADDQPVLFHDFHITSRVCSALPADAKVPVRSLSLERVRTYRIDCRVGAGALPLAERFARERGIDPYGIPTLMELFEFVSAYAGRMGLDVGKTDDQRLHARAVILDIELKREPFHPHLVGDGFTGTGPATLERWVAHTIRQAGVIERSRARSFDHRSVLAIKQLEPNLRTAVLIHDTVPAQVAPLLEGAQAELYCPSYRCVDAEVVRQVHAAGARIIPYTVNEPDDWKQLIEWGVDGVTTDYPDRLFQWLDVNGYPRHSRLTRFGLSR